MRAIASCFQLPLYRVDMIEIFSGRHGRPEGVFVEACHMMEDMAPAVLWFDEIEMGIGIHGEPGATRIELPMVRELAVTGARTAKVNYGARGWVAHHNSDIWAQSAPVGDYGKGDPVWANWHGGSAWLSQHLWEHYLFSGDKAFLRDTAYPLMKGAAIATTTTAATCATARTSWSWPRAAGRRCRSAGRGRGPRRRRPPDRRAARRHHSLLPRQYG